MSIATNASEGAPSHRCVSQTLSGWGNYPRATCQLYRPEKIRDVAAIADGKGIISRGLGRSYGDAAVNAGGGVLSHLRLNRLLAMDDELGVLHCEAGATLDEILRFALPRGYFPPVTPGTRFVTIGGAIAADVHGKNHHAEGSFASFLVDFRLLTGGGQTLTCSRRQNPDVFWATVGGMGLTGAILDARFMLKRVPSAYVSVDYERTSHLDDTLERFASRDHEYTYSVAWIDCLAGGRSLGRSVMMRGRHSQPAELTGERADLPYALPKARGKSIPCYLPGAMLNAWTVRAFNALYYRLHGDRSAVVPYPAFFYPLDAISNWNRIYGRRGFVQYQALFPNSTSRAGLTALLEAISASRQASFLAVLKTFGAANEGLLSFPHAGHTLALDLPNTGQRLTELLQQLDLIVLRHGGRVYLAKDACLSPEAFEAMYPQAERFRQIKARLDPAGCFTSSLARRLGLIATSRKARLAA